MVLHVAFRWHETEELDHLNTATFGVNVIWLKQFTDEVGELCRSLRHENLASVNIFFEDIWDL